MTTAIVQTRANLQTLLSGEQMQSQLRAITSHYLSPEKVVRLALLASSRQPLLLKCTVPSLLRAILDASQLGLDFGGGVTTRAHIVPFYSQKLSAYEAVLIPDYKGLIQIAYQSGQVRFIDAQLVYQEDTYEYELGTSPFVKHRPCLSGERGQLLFGYGIVLLTGSNLPKIEIMTDAELEAIHQRSKAASQGPWVTDPSEMKRKTLIKRILKYIPTNPNVDKALEIDNQEDSESKHVDSSVLDESVDRNTGEVLTDVPGFSQTQQPPAANVAGDSEPQKRDLINQICIQVGALHPADDIQTEAERLKTLKHVFGKTQIDEIGKLPTPILEAGLRWLENEVRAQANQEVEQCPI